LTFYLSPYFYNDHIIESNSNKYKQTTYMTHLTHRDVWKKRCVEKKLVNPQPMPSRWMSVLLTIGLSVVLTLLLTDIYVTLTI